MTMILQMLVVGVAVGLGAAGLQIPKYAQYAASLSKAAEALTINVISMEGHTPLLNDSRRHYVEIIHVVNALGQNLTEEESMFYEESYDLYLNGTVEVAISYPQYVVTDVKNLLGKVNNNTDKIQELIEACTQPEETCNKLIYDTINADLEEYGHQSDVFVEAALTAQKFNEKNARFEQISKDLNANQYVCTSGADLRGLVEAVAKLYVTLNELQ